MQVYADQAIYNATMRGPRAALAGWLRMQSAAASISSREHIDRLPHTIRPREEMEFQDTEIRTCLPPRDRTAGGSGRTDE
jgi:hypothetical protein